MSDDGIVWSFWKPGAAAAVDESRRRKTWSLRLDLSPRRLKPVDNGHGYLYVKLGASGPRDYLHRWVWRGWRGPIPKGQQVRHYDGDPSNNKLANLRLGSIEANAADKAMHDRHPVGERSVNAKLTETQVLEARRLYRSGVTLTDLISLLDLQVSRSILLRAVTGSNWTHLDHIEAPASAGRLTQLRGESVVGSKLTDALVAEARRLRRESDLTTQEIADELGVSVTIYALNSAIIGASWKHLNEISTPARRMSKRR